MSRYYAPPRRVRFSRQPLSRHGPIKRIVGDTPMVTLYNAECARLKREADLANGVDATRSDDAVKGTDESA